MINYKVPFGYKYKNLIFIISILLIFGGYFAYTELHEINEVASVSAPSVIINNSIISVEIADEASERWQGLSDRANLGENNGMLFIFPNLQKRTFVMRRMHFPLDIIWIKDDEIVGIASNLAPEGENPTELYSSPELINYVLEVNGGYCDAFGIRKGDVVEISY